MPCKHQRKKWAPHALNAYTKSALFVQYSSHKEKEKRNDLTYKTCGRSLLNFNIYKLCHKRGGGEFHGAVCELYNNTILLATLIRRNVCKTASERVCRGMRFSYLRWEMNRVAVKNTQWTIAVMELMVKPNFFLNV